MSKSHPFSRHFTLYIVLGMLAGIATGLLLKWLPISASIREIIVFSVLQTGGKIFINLITMLVIPVVFLSLVCGSASLGDLRTVGRMGVKTIALYLFTTTLAITVALFIAHLLGVGIGMPALTKPITLNTQPPLFHQVIVNMFPKNPVKAMAEGNMLQVIIFAILLGVAMGSFGSKAARVKSVFDELNLIFMRLIIMIMKLAPIGVFCLLSVLAVKVGFSVIQNLAGYFIAVLIVLMIQLLLIYPAFLSIFSRLNPLVFIKKMRAAMLFAFSVSSSNASIPIMLSTVENKLGVNNSLPI